MTEEEKKLIVEDVVALLRENSKQVKDRPEETNLDNMSSLLGLDTQGVMKQVPKDKFGTKADLATVADNLTNEVQRAKDAEAALQKQIDEIPTTGGGGTGDIADGSVTERKLSTDVKNKLNTAYDKATLADSLFINDGIEIYKGALRADEDPELNPDNPNLLFSSKIIGNGETVVLADGFSFVSYKTFDGDTEFDYVRYVDKKLTLEEGNVYQLGIRRDDGNGVDDVDFSKVIKSFIRNPYTWGKYSNLDNFTQQGRYTISGEREANAQDNMPILNGGNIEARLEVLENENTLVQILSLLNVGGGDGNIYTRTRQNGSWGSWGKLQANIEVGLIGVGQSKTFDDFIDNGMYSGVNAYWVDTVNYITSVETFVLVVINAYLYGGGVAQLKYSTLLDGTTTVKIRTRVDGSWGDWQSIGGGITREEFELLQQSISDEIQNIDNSISTFNRTIINYNTRYNIAGAVTKQQVIEDLLNKGTADKGCIVTYYAEDGWHTIQYKLNYYNPTQGVKESNWVEIGGSSYTLPVATGTVLGGIKSATSRPIGSDISEGRKCDVYVDGNSGLAHVVVAPASYSSYGVVKVDNSINSESSNPVMNKAISQALEDAVARGRELAKRDLYVSAGALYNDTDEVIKRTAFWGEEVDHLPKHYYLNGLGDITEEQMSDIYNIKDWTMLLRTNASRLYQYSRVRTILTVPNTRTWEFDAFISAESMLYGSNLEVFNCTNSPATMRLNAFNCNGTTKLKFIGGAFDCGIVSKDINGFTNATALEFVRIGNIRSNISFEKSKNLRKDTILYLIQNVYKSLSTAITVTLHSNVYSKCIEGGEWYEEVNTALTTANAAITGGGSINIVSA